MLASFSSGPRDAFLVNSLNDAKLISPSPESLSAKQMAFEYIFLPLRLRGGAQKTLLFLLVKCYFVSAATFSLCKTPIAPEGKVERESGNLVPRVV
jgi:hypothetical protein